MNQQKVEIFYGEENVPGKKWQSLFEWLKAVEMGVCRHINDKPSQLFEVMSYLSPNIKKIAEAHRPAFRTYNDLKAWLIKNHVNEARIVRELQNKIASVVPTKLKDVSGYVVHTRGILASMEEHCESYPRLRAMMLSDKNVAALIQFILGQISYVTERNEFVEYLTETWIPFANEMKAAGTPTTLEQELKKMEEHLDKVLELAKVWENYNQRIKETHLSGPQSQQEQEESDDDDSKEGFEDEQSEAGEENAEAEAEENYCVKCHYYFESANDFAQFDYGYNYDGWVCWDCATSV